MKLIKTGENRFQYGDKKLTSIFTQTLCEGCVLAKECNLYSSKIGNDCEELVGRGSLVELKEKTITEKSIENLKKLVQEMIGSEHVDGYEGKEGYSVEDIHQKIDNWVEENTND